MLNDREAKKMTRAAAILGGEKELGQKIKNPIDFDALIRKGMPLRAMYHVKKEFNLSDEVLARIIGASLRTVARRRRVAKASHVHVRERLSPVQSDRLYRFARIIALAEDVFESIEDALEWLNSKQHGLGGAVPFDMLQTDAGAREVEALLIRIDYGVIS
jgi:putative toxin-antitoxin system antitoxin component (TIGR02293 family)